MRRLAISIPSPPAWNDFAFALVRTVRADGADENSVQAIHDDVPAPEAPPPCRVQSGQQGLSARVQERDRGRVRSAR